MSKLGSHTWGLGWISRSAISLEWSYNNDSNILFVPLLHIIYDVWCEPDKRCMRLSLVMLFKQWRSVSFADFHTISGRGPNQEFHLYCIGGYICATSSIYIWGGDTQTRRIWRDMQRALIQAGTDEKSGYDSCLLVILVLRNSPRTHDHIYAISRPGNEGTSQLL